MGAVAASNGPYTLGFNPLVIGSSVLMGAVAASNGPYTLGFNPLVIGSSVLMEKAEQEKAEQEKFQSPSNRVKCSD